MATITDSYSNNNSPATITDVTFVSTRNGANVTVTATVTVTMRYASGYFNYDGEINFNMWSGSNYASANIKTYSERWTTSMPRSRTRTCSMTFANTGGALSIGWNVTVPSGHSSIAVPERYVSLGVPSYNAPTAPSWININPNPCEVNSSALISWGGASAGSLGVLRYDVQVRALTPSNAWTSWVTLAYAQAPTSFTVQKFTGTTVSGQTPYVGIKYQYRVRSNDNAYASSGWITTPELGITFIAPTVPTNYMISDTSVKKDGSLDISWSGATGGSGTIASYVLEYRFYNHRTSSWSAWDSISSSSADSYTFNVQEFQPTASNGDLIQFRIKTINSWGQESTYLITSSIKVRGNQLWIKKGGSWVEGECYIKSSGSWKEGTPYVKTNGSWKESV